MTSIMPMPTPICWCPRAPHNGGIVPPWLREPVRIVLPVEPPDPSEPVLPVQPPSTIVVVSS